MTDPEQLTDDELMAEIHRRSLLGRCPRCRRWATYVGVYDADGRTLRCRGCLRAVSKCRCA